MQKIYKKGGTKTVNINSWKIVFVSIAICFSLNIYTLKAQDHLLPNLVVWYDFEDTESSTITDLSENNLNGQIVGALSKQDGKLLFDGNPSNYLLINHNELLNGSNGLSICFSMQFNNPASDQSCNLISKKEYWDATTGYEINYWGQYSSLGILGSGNESYISFNILDTSYHQLIFVFHNSTTSFYVDNVLVQDNIPVSSIQDNTREIKIGDGLTGSIEEFKIYNTALMASQIDSIFLPVTKDTTLPHIIIDSIPPTAPKGLSATAVSGTQVELSWLQSIDSLEVDKYIVFREQAVIDSTSEIIFTDTGLDYSTTYTYSVAAIDTAGNISDTSQEVSVSTFDLPIPDTSTLNPVLWYDFEDTEIGNVLDISENNLNGQIVGELSKQDGKLLFDGNPSNYLLINHNELLNGSNGLSICFSMQFNNPASDQSCNLISKKEYWDATTGYEINYWGQYSSLGILGSGNESYISYNILDTSYHQLIFVFHNSTTSFYVDNVLVQDNMPISPIQDNTREIKIGDGLTGSIDEIKIYNNSLDSTQIKNVFKPAERDTIAPTSPTEFVATAISETQVELNWSPSTDNFGVARYIIYRDNVEISFTTANQYFDTNLSPGTTYTYNVTAVDINSNLSELSLPATITTSEKIDTIPPSIPQDLTIQVISGTQAELHWSPSLDESGIAGYNIYRDNSLISTTDSTGYAENSLTYNTTYTYQVLATDSAGNLSELSNSVTITTPQYIDTIPPSVPQGLSASFNGTLVQLSWEPSTDNLEVLGYEIFRNDTLFDTVDASFYNDIYIQNNLLYVYNVRSFDSAGNYSQLSNDVSIVTNINSDTGFVINHTNTDISAIPISAINDAKNDLHIAYGHTSHGGQLISGMVNIDYLGATYLLDAFMNNNGVYLLRYGGGSDGVNTYLDIRSNFIQQSDWANVFNPNRDVLVGASSLGEYGDTAWLESTRNYINDVNFDTNPNNDINVIMWSWCRGIIINDTSGIETYLASMEKLEMEYPAVKFVYMTGHLYDAKGIDFSEEWDASLYEQTNSFNELIRQYCITNNKILYDFADIESYDPDGNYYGDLFSTDACNYDANNDSETSQTGDPAQPTNGDLNWAEEWAQVNQGMANINDASNNYLNGGRWYGCNPEHTHAVNGNQKSYAAWFLFARLAGWDGVTGQLDESHLKSKSEAEINIGQESISNEILVYPNPATENIFIKLNKNTDRGFYCKIEITNSLGSAVLLKTINLSKEPYILNIESLSTGIYVLSFELEKETLVKKIIIK